LAGCDAARLFSPGFDTPCLRPGFIEHLSSSWQWCFHHATDEQIGMFLRRYSQNTATFGTPINILKKKVEKKRKKKNLLDN